MGLKVVRVGQPEKVREHLQHATLDAQVKLAKELAAEERQIKAKHRAAVISLPARINSWFPDRVL